MRPPVAILLLVLLLPCFAGAAPVSAIPVTWHIVQLDQRRYVPVTDVAAFYRMALIGSNAHSFRLTARNRVIEGRADASEVRINGVKYVTCFPLRSRDNRVYLSAMDVTKILEPLMRPGKIQGAKSTRTVVLDAGHGGHDSGAIGPYGREKDYTLDVVLRARALLLRAGFQVKMTRTSDVFIPLEERARFANGFPGALFVSVHFNKSNSGGTGIETYALAPRGVPSMDEGSLRYSDFRQNPGNARDAENIALAAAVHSMLVRQLPLPDRGIKRARFVVIKNITIPGVLIEGGFVDNVLDSRYIALPAYRQRIAQSIVDAAAAYTRTITGAPAPTAVITVGPTPAPLLSLEEALAAAEAKSAPRPTPTTPPAAASPYRPSGGSRDAAPAFNLANPAFGLPPAPFDQWKTSRPALPFSTVNPFLPPPSLPKIPLTPGFNAAPSGNSLVPPDAKIPSAAPVWKRARPSRDFPRTAPAPTKSSPASQASEARSVPPRDESEDQP